MRRLRSRSTRWGLALVGAVVTTLAAWAGGPPCCTDRDLSPTVTSPLYGFYPTRWRAMPTDGQPPMPTGYDTTRQTPVVVVNPGPVADSRRSIAIPAGPAGASHTGTPADGEFADRR